MEHTTIRFRVLGSLEVDGADLSGLRPAQCRLLSLLLLQPGLAIHRDELIDRMWPVDAPTTARNTLQAHVSGLRRSLGADSVVLSNGAYRLDVATEQVDARVFARRSEDARSAVASDPARAIELGSQALSLWRGEPFGCLRDDTFALPDIVRLQELRFVALEAELAGRHRMGRLGEVTADLEALVLQRPHRETLWGYLALARHVTGRRAEALHTFTEARQALAEVGIGLGGRLQALQRGLLRDEASPAADSLVPALAS